MSLGYKGMCKKVLEDEETAIYSYSGENWNDEGKSKAGDYLLQDGIIIIYKRCLEEPEIHIKLKRMPSGRKKVITKRIKHVASILEHIKNGDIIIDKECKNAFRRANEDNPDYIARMLLHKIFDKYQENGKLPECAVFHQ